MTAGVRCVLPAEWTGAVAADPFVVVSAGRSPFHVGLLELSELVPGLAAGRTASCQADYAVNVEEIMPRGAGLAAAIRRL